MGRNDERVLVLGWSLDQWAQAKQRHFEHVGEAVPADMEGMFVLHQWWCYHAWPAPLSLKLEGVDAGGDYAWAAKAFLSAIRECGAVGQQ